jgi:hypothetical protein
MLITWVKLCRNGLCVLTAGMYCLYRVIGVRFPAEANYFSSSLCGQTGSGAHPASYRMRTGDPSPGSKARPGRDADHLPPYSAEVKNE